jgi:hypothetical protein
MRRLVPCLRLAAAVSLLPLLVVQPAFAWGNDGHMMINRLAGEALPSDVPEFLRSKSALEALAFYGPIPDTQFRGRSEPELNAVGAPEHFIDMEWADLAGPLPRNRYDYVRALEKAQAAHPDIPLTVEKVGLQPYETNELYQRLKSAMRDYRALVAAKKDAKPSEAEIIFLAGWLGHYVGDGSMPLHTTIQYNGWTGANPNGYTTEHHIHALFESDFVHANVRASDVAPLIAAKPVVLNDVFTDYVAYLRHSNTLVDQTYQLEKAGAFADAGTPEGKAFIEQQLAAGATELRDIIYTAWVKSGDQVPAYHGN